MPKKPENHQYYLLIVNKPDYDNLIAVLRAAHKRTWPANELRIVLNKTGTKALVKVDWGDQTPITLPANLKLKGWSRAEHAGVVAELKNDEWKTEETVK